MSASPRPVPPSRAATLAIVALAVLLLGAGLAGHLLSAHAIGGYWFAYRDHVFGFVLILAVTGGIIALVGRRFWPRRGAWTLLVIGLVQALFGYLVWRNRFGIR